MKHKFAAFTLGFVSLTFINNTLAKEILIKDPCPLVFYGEMITANESVSLCVNGSKAVFERKDLNTDIVKIKVEKEASYFSTITTKDITAVYFRDPEDHKYWYSLEDNKGVGTFVKLIDNNYTPENHVPHVAKYQLFPLKGESLVLDKDLIKTLNKVANNGKA